MVVKWDREINITLNAYERSKAGDLMIVFGDNDDLKDFENTI